MKIYLSLILSIILLHSCTAEPTNNKTNEDVLHFDKIIFHTSMCFGTCPTYHLEVENNKSLRLYAERVYSEDSYDTDSTKTGYYTGYVTDTTFDKLNSELGQLNIDSLEFPEEFCCDGSVITIIVYYDGKRKYLSSMWPPAEASKLIGVLYEICRNSDLVRTEDYFHIEDEK